MGNDMNKQVLFVGKDPVELELLRERFEPQLKGWDIITVSNGKEAIRIVNDQEISAVLSDARMHGFSGIEFLRCLKRVRKRIPVLVMVSSRDIEAAVDAIKLGAHDVLEKPLWNDLNRVVMLIRDAASQMIGGTAQPEFDSG